MSIKKQCPSCNYQIEEDSVFCHHCGQRIPEVDENKQTIVNKTADLFDLDGALKAISTYFTQWPDGPEARDVSFAYNCLCLFTNVVTIGQGKYELVYKDVSRLADAAGQGLPIQLANELITSAKVREKEKRDKSLKTFRIYMIFVRRPFSNYMIPPKKSANPFL